MARDGSRNIAGGRHRDTGLVSADGVAATLAIRGLTTNTSRMAAINTSTLSFGNVKVANTGGTISAESSGGAVVLTGTTVNEGTLESQTGGSILMSGTTVLSATLTGGGSIIASDSNTFDSTESSVTIDTDTTVDVPEFSNLQLIGTIVNNGTIRMSGRGTEYGALYYGALNPSGDVVLNGDGRILFADAGTIQIGAVSVTTTGDVGITNGGRLERHSLILLHH